MLPPHLPHYPAPAKLNLDLRIIRQRPDGYHDIESIFTLINLADTLAIAPRHDNQLILHTPTPNVPPAQDLTIRAAQALRQAAQGSLKANTTPFGADIWLHKTIPMGGGLGGGSSNAATVLLVLNHLWQCHFSPEQLIQIATPLGADVPFFIYGQTAFARGIGEQLQPIAIPPQQPQHSPPQLRRPATPAQRHAKHRPRKLPRRCHRLPPTASLRPPPAHRFRRVPIPAHRHPSRRPTHPKPTPHQPRKLGSQPPAHPPTKNIFPKINKPLPTTHPHHLDKPTPTHHNPRFHFFNRMKPLGSRQAVKTLDFDSSMRRFESFLPSQPISFCEK